MSIDLVHAPGRLRVILDAPHGNAITDAMVGGLRGALKSVKPTIKLITIESAARISASARASTSTRRRGWRRSCRAFIR